MARLNMLIAWCGFIGSWLLVAGPLDQALRELREEDFERESLLRASRHVEPLPPISRRWILIPPVYVVLVRRRSNAYRTLIAQQMDPEELSSMAHLRDVAAAWIYVAAGAALIAVAQTWALHDSYGWPTWGFWLTVAVVLAILAGRIWLRAVRPDVPPTDPTVHAGRAG